MKSFPIDMNAIVLKLVQKCGLQRTTIIQEAMNQHCFSTHIWLTNNNKILNGTRTLGRIPSELIGTLTLKSDVRYVVFKNAKLVRYYQLHYE